MEKLRQVWSRWRRSLRLLWSSVKYRLGESGWTGVPWSRRLRAPQLPRLWPQTRSAIERNIAYLYLEMFWSGIFSAAFAFNATYALRLGASNAVIGWLSSIPALLAIGVLVPSARFLESRVDRSPWLYGSLFVGRLAFVGAAVAPWIFPRRAAEVVVAVLIARSIPMHVFSAGYSPLLADIIPVRDRALVMSNRSIINSATVAVCTFLFGRWMDAANTIAWARFPVNYQVVYLVGTVAGLLSAYFVSRIRVPQARVVREWGGGGAGLLKRPQLPRFDHLWSNARATVRENRMFVRIVVNTFIFDFGAWLVGPLYMIFFVNQLDASDTWVGLNTTVAHIGVIAGYFIWRWVVDRKGFGRTLLLAVPLAASYPFLVSFFPNLNLILLFGVLINLITPGVTLSHTGSLYTLCPVDRRASYLALYATVSNIGAFVAPMLGVALSNLIDIRWILLIGGAIRLGGAAMFHLFRIELAEASPA